MNRYLQGCIGAVALAGLLAGSPGYAAVDELGNKPLPAGMKKGCAANLDDFGGEGRPATSIQIQSYTSDQPLAAALAFYEKQFGVAPQSREAGQFEWQRAKGLYYALYSAESEAGRRRFNCKALPAGTLTILIITQAHSVSP